MSDAPSNDASQKRLRNRLSQQAFRKRQSAYIKDLERRLEIRDNDENGQIAQLERDNRALREQLTKACGKLERIQITLRSLSNTMMSHVSHGPEANLPTPQDSMTRSLLADENEGERTEIANGARTNAPTSPDTPIQAGDPGPEPDDDADAFFPSFGLEDLTTAGQDASEAVMGNIDSFSNAPPLPGSHGTSSLDVPAFLDKFPDNNFFNIRGLSGIWSHEYQMGLSTFHYQTSSTNKTGRALAGTNSSFSDHTQMIRRCLVTKWTRAKSLQPEAVTEDGLRLSGTLMMSLFHSLSRPAALTWYTATKFQENIADLLLWQINRSRVVYSRLHANYRPSALQLVEDYPSVIDWCPFPTVRDKLILLHAANPCLDQIICDIATAYSVEVDIG